MSLLTWEWSRSGVHGRGRVGTASCSKTLRIVVSRTHVRSKARQIFRLSDQQTDLSSRGLSILSR